MQKKTFLLADDDVDDREMFCEALASIDDSIACHAVKNGREALEALNGSQQLPKLIFLDVNMPIMSGWECLEKLKSDEQYKDIPVIIISTSSNAREIDTAAKLGAVCYFTKPHDYKDLISVLETIVDNNGAELGQALHNLEQSGSKYVRILA